jgi:dTDP-4-dehydrorhamnose 3,5-epimerase
MMIQELSIGGAYQVAIDPIADERGFFARTFCADIFDRLGLVSNFAQSSISFNRERGTLRGLHYQASPHAETKLIRCTQGTVFDVIVDFRPQSPTYTKWQSIELSSENRIGVYVPAGCAHGFQTLTDNVEILYQITPAYVVDAARGIAWDDPQLKIAWPLPVRHLSQKDRARPFMKTSNFSGL